MRAATVLLACALLAGAVAPAPAQRIGTRSWPRLGSASPRRARLIPLSSPSGSARSDSVAIQPTRWWERGVTLGLATGLLFAGAGVALASEQVPAYRHYVASALIGFAAGGMFGFTVGALFRGQAPSTAP